MKLNMLSQKIQQKIVKEKSKVTQGRIEKYYNENKSQYGTPEKRDVQIILTKTEAAGKAAKKEIESGKSFASRQEDSIDPASKANGGPLAGSHQRPGGEGTRQRDLRGRGRQARRPRQDPVRLLHLRGQVRSSPATSSPLEGQYDDRAAARRHRPADGAERIRQEFKKKWTAKTDCQPEYVVPDCKQYKAPKA